MKNYIFISLIAFGISFFSTSCSSDNVIEPVEVQNLEAETILNVRYGENPQQVYDVYLPANRNTSKTKVIILVHGGGWTEGDKADMANFVTLIQQNLPNHAIVNMNYVLAALPNTPAFPNQYLDVDRVINKLTEDKEMLDILPEFGMIGVSAGAHLSLIYDSVYDTDNQVKMVADIVGPSDFTDPFYSNDPNFNFLLEFLVDESAYPPNTNYAEANSPVFRVTTATSPTLLFYGNQDPLVPLTNGQALNNALTNADITHNFTVYEGGHGNDWSGASIADLQTQLITYVNLYLGIPNL